MRRSGVRLPKAAPAQTLVRGSRTARVELYVEPTCAYLGSMATAEAPRKRHRGEIEKLPSGSLRVRVYAGIDPITRKKHYLTEVIPVGRGAAKASDRARTRLLAQVDDQRSPKTRATVNQMLDRHL